MYLEKDREENTPAGNWLYIICIEPNKKPYFKIIENSLEVLQELVDGYIETFTIDRTPTNATISLIFNEDGNLRELPTNRVLIIDNIRINLKGTILIIKTNVTGITCDLRDDEAERYITMFSSKEIIL